MIFALDESLFDAWNEEDAAVSRLLEGVFGGGVGVPLLVSQHAKDLQVQAVELLLNFLQVCDVLALLTQQTLLLLLQ